MPEKGQFFNKDTARIAILDELVQEVKLPIAVRFCNLLNSVFVPRYAQLE